MEYWVQRWVDLRKKEMVKYPDVLPVHSDYITKNTEDGIANAFHVLYDIMQRLYIDMMQEPERMLLPLHGMHEYDYFSNQNRLSREASYQYARLLYIVGITGECNEEQDSLFVSVGKLKEACKKMKIANVSKKLELLKAYGFQVNGVENGKFTKGLEDIMVYFPTCAGVMSLLKLLSDKAQYTDRFSDFCRLNYKLLKDGKKRADFGNGIDYITDLFKREEERKTAEQIHNELINRGYIFQQCGWNEGPQLRYYKNEADLKKNSNSPFWLTSMDAKFQFYFRIRNIDKVLEFIKTCPESVIQTFLCSDKGCKNRGAGCKSGIQYELLNKTVWRCGCCNPNFQAAPQIEDYIYYIDAVELSTKK